jgi:hypothetical protein
MFGQTVSIKNFLIFTIQDPKDLSYSNSNREKDKEPFGLWPLVDTFGCLILRARPDSWDLWPLGGFCISSIYLNILFFGHCSWIRMQTLLQVSCVACTCVFASCHISSPLIDGACFGQSISPCFETDTGSYHEIWIGVMSCSYCGSGPRQVG